MNIAFTRRPTLMIVQCFGLKGAIERRRNNNFAFQAAEGDRVLAVGQLLDLSFKLRLVAKPCHSARCLDLTPELAVSFLTWPRIRPVLSSRVVTVAACFP